MSAIVWVHGDSISPTSAAISRFPKSPAIFVFDDLLLSEYRLSFKRLVFLYESLLELPVTIRRGSIASEVLEFARQHQATQVITTLSPSPYFRKVVQNLESHVTVRILTEPMFAADQHYDLARFSRYWSKAQRSVMSGALDQ